jgi:hypothetical protein
MGARVTPARPRLEDPRVERIEYLELTQGKITVDQYREAIVRGLLLHQGRWHRGRG